MSIIPAFVNAIFTLNKKGEYPLSEGPIEGGYTRVSIICRLTQGIRYYKVKQIIALEGQMAIKQDFEISQELAYKLIEKDLMEKSLSMGEEEVEDESTEEKLEVVITGQSYKSNPSNPAGAQQNINNISYQDNNPGSYKSVVSTQSRKLEEGSPQNFAGVPDFNDSSFNSLNNAMSGGFSEGLGGGDIKIANMSSFSNGSNTVRTGSKSSSYANFEDMFNQ